MAVYNHFKIIDDTLNKVIWITRFFSLQQSRLITGAAVVCFVGFPRGLKNLNNKVDKIVLT